MSCLQKKILIINDISCLGRCSLTVLHPFLSCAGFETIMLPTSLLSNHTAYDNYTFLDLSDEMNNIIECWKNLRIKFDAIISGYLGNEKQIELVLKIKKLFLKDNGLFIVDPVMADNGNLYKGFSDNFPTKMIDLIRYADIITPNITEATLLTNTNYKEYYEIHEIEEIINKLQNLGAKNVTVTGIKHLNKTGVFFRTDNSQTKHYFHKKFNYSIHGAGDVYLGALIGAYLNNKSFDESNEIATKYTYKSIIEAQKTNTNPLEGLPFEINLKYYINKIK